MRVRQGHLIALGRAGFERIGWFEQPVRYQESVLAAALGTYGANDLQA